jgi:hypothetical protein
MNAVDPYAYQNILSQLGAVGGVATPPHILNRPLMPPFQETPTRPGDVVPYGPRFGIEKIANGFIIHFGRGNHTDYAEKHFVANEKEAGEFVTSRLIQLMLEEGNRKNAGAEPKAAK